jgi:prepilin-type processing-associated H-X9-DG protein
MRTPRLWEGILVVAVAGFAFYFLAARLFYLLHGDDRLSARGQCLSNVKHIMLALKQYSEDFGGSYPWHVGAEKPDEPWRDLGLLFPNYNSGFKSFFCPVSRDRPHVLNKEPLEPFAPATLRDPISYAYCIDARDPNARRPWDENALSTQRLIADKKAGTRIGGPGNPVKLSNHGDDGRNVAYHDGHVKWTAGPGALDPDPDDNTVGDPAASDYHLWWSDPPYRGQAP